MARLVQKLTEAKIRALTNDRSDCITTAPVFICKFGQAVRDLGSTAIG